MSPTKSQRQVPLPAIGVFQGLETGHVTWYDTAHAPAGHHTPCPNNLPGGTAISSTSSAKLYKTPGPQAVPVHRDQDNRAEILSTLGNGAAGTSPMEPQPLHAEL